eukprot:1018678-Amphidinium_carterae.1
METTPAEVLANRKSVGLHSMDVGSFIDNVEFVSLGNYCAIAVTMAMLGLRIDLSAATPHWAFRKFLGSVSLMFTLGVEETDKDEDEQKV